MIRIEQIKNDELLDHITDANLYMVTFNDKQKPGIVKVATSKLNDILAADCYLKFVEESDEEGGNEETQPEQG